MRPTAASGRIAPRCRQKQRQGAEITNSQQRFADEIGDRYPVRDPQWLVVWRRAPARERSSEAQPDIRRQSQSKAYPGTAPQKFSVCPKIIEHAGTSGGVAQQEKCKQQWHRGQLQPLKQECLPRVHGGDVAERACGKGRDGLRSLFVQQDVARVRRGCLVNVCISVGWRCHIGHA
jgi:hypothetical protein